MVIERYNYVCKGSGRLWAREERERERERESERERELEREREAGREMRRVE